MRKRVEDAARVYQDNMWIPTTAFIKWNEVYLFALRQPDNQGVFHLGKSIRYWNDDYAKLREEGDWGYIYQPIHQSMKPEDIEGATYAYDDGTHWLFAHCSPHEQIDFAIETQTFCFDLFAEPIARALNSAETGANTKARALIDLAEQSSNEVFREIRSATLGEYHRDPHKDWRRDLSLAAIKKVHKAWTDSGTRAADLPKVKAAYDDLKTRLEREWAIDWRHTREEDWSRAGRDPVGDYEYVFTVVPTADHVIADADLPDPNWHFDAAPVGGYKKATQTYTDGAPLMVPTGHWILPFRRPVRIGTKVGVSIGSVAWTRRDAYQRAPQ